MGDPTPLAYGLLNVTTGKLILTNVYARYEVAVAGAQRTTNRFRTVVAIPLFGPEALALMQERIDVASGAENALRQENIHLRNQIAELRGRVVAEAHAAGLPAPTRDDLTPNQGPSSGNAGPDEQR